MSPATAFFVLRHGQTDWNLQARLQGSTDIPLNETGRQQVRHAANILAARGLTKIITSPLSRALESAQIVGVKAGIKSTIDDRLTERNFGLFEGMTLDEVQRERANMRTHMNPRADLDGKHYPDNAEPLRDVIERVYACINEHRAGGDICLFVFHGIPFRAVSHKFINEMYSSPNAAPVKFEQAEGRWHMIPLDLDNAPVHASKFDGPTTMGRL